MKKSVFLGLAAAAVSFLSCNLNPAEDTGTVTVLTTSADGTKLLESSTTAFAGPTMAAVKVVVDDKQQFQTMEGFGYALTGGSAQVLYKMAPDKRKALLQELFDTTGTALGISYLRISIGASDLDASVFSYDDLPAGKTDTALASFSIDKDRSALIPVLKEILAIRPDLRIMGSPWSPPVWMKDNDSTKGGHLLKKYYGVYAAYFVRYIKAYAFEGITIDAVTLQNEPEHGGNNPSLLMTATEQAELIRDHVGPAFAAAGLKTRILAWDHNGNHPEYPITVLNDSAARKYVYGAAFHLYEGDETALSKVKTAHPDKALYFTEQWTGSKSDFAGDFKWHIKHIVIGTTRNWSSVVLEWNLASDSTWNPHTPGGCTECKGALTIDGDQVKRNVSYYIIGQASRMIPPGSVRISSTEPDGLSTVAFKTPQGKTVLLVLNEGDQPREFTVVSGDKQFIQKIGAGSAITCAW